MRVVSVWPLVLGFALAMALVNIIEPIEHSLSFAGGALAIIALLGWVLEARALAGPPPEVEPEHEEEEEAPGPSYWPVVLAAGVVAIAAGLVYDWGYLGLAISLPLAGAAAAAWVKDIQAEQQAGPAQLPWFVPPAQAPPTAPADGAATGAAGGFLMPVPQRTLAAQAAGGAAIAIEQVEGKQISRRGLLRITFWAGLGAGLAGLTASLIDMLYPRGVVGFGGVVAAGTVDQFPPGTKTRNNVGKFWLVNLTEAQGGPGFLALWWKCPHLGCTVPWLDNFTWPDPATGQPTQGWFRCPCHGSTYDDAGVRVFGPAPRSMDRMALTIDPNSGRISVNTGRVTKGTPDNANFAVRTQ
jgi:cytochrome b6-f complex iron-sulfur subunit